MSLLKTSKLSTRRNTLLLIAACLLLAAPCVAAAALALQFDIDNPEAGISQQQEQRQEASQKIERAREDLQRAREELQRKGREIQERMRKNPNAQGAELEALHRMQRELEEAAARLGHEQEAQHMKAAEEGLRQLHERLAQALATYPADEARMREARKKLEQDLEQLRRSLPENEERSRELQQQLAMIEKQYLNTKLNAEELRRAQQEIAQHQEALTQQKREMIEEKLKLQEHQLMEREQQKREKIEEKLKLNEQQLMERELQKREAFQKMEAVEREVQNKIRNKEYDKLIRKELDMRVRKELEEAGLQGGAQGQSELTQLATISMDRAIQIAVSQHPGKVLACSLGRQKDGQVFYRLVIISRDGDKTSAKHVWVSATDGRILNTEHE